VKVVNHTLAVLMPVLREGGMVGHIAIEPEAAEPPIRQIKMNFFAQTPLGTDGAVTYDQHPDHQLGINRGPANGAVEQGQLAARPIESHHFAGGDRCSADRTPRLPRPQIAACRVALQTAADAAQFPGVRFGRSSSLAACPGALQPEAGQVTHPFALSWSSSSTASNRGGMADVHANGGASNLAPRIDHTWL
jgi:hypothetical protein